MKTYYLSLGLGLTGCYVKFLAPDEESVGRYAAAYFGHLPGAVYTEAYFYEIVRKREGRTRIVNRDFPIELKGDA